MIERTIRLRDCVLPEVLLIVAVIFLAIVFKTELLMSGVSNWHTVGVGSGEVSPAGRWFNLVSTPFFRFLLFRWLWRLFLWALFLWRVSRVNLFLVATHTDMAGLQFGRKGYRFPLACVEMCQSRIDR